MIGISVITEKTHIISVALGLCLWFALGGLKSERACNNFSICALLNIFDCNIESDADRLPGRLWEEGRKIFLRNVWSFGE
jgi:hypothetical protein